ncbi:MAG TPA: hypothetical protein VHC95_05210 [Opitutales bacterium]|nr:hypothetical protein [Opitutales bacterium]
MAKPRKPPAPPPGYDPVDAGFLEARGKLIEVAAFLDRAERRKRFGDYRVRALQGALKKLAAAKKSPSRAELVLRAFSDPTSAPARHAGPPAAGAWSKKSTR